MKSIYSWRKLKGIGLVLVAFFILQGCSGFVYGPQEVGVWYEMKPGDTLPNLAHRYKVTEFEIKRRNEIIDPEDLAPGMILFIPGAATAGRGSGEVRFPKMGRSNPMIKSGKRLIWPANGTISSGFGKRHGRMHEGIDITADGGRRIVAAASGVVEFAGRMRGYGNTLVINHGHGVKTLYGHNARNFVRKGQRVRQGQRIAKLGNTGKSTGPHLHFEVQIKGKPRNPLRYLPLR